MDLHIGIKEALEELSRTFFLLTLTFKTLLQVVEVHALGSLLLCLHEALIVILAICSWLFCWINFLDFGLILLLLLLFVVVSCHVFELLLYLLHSGEGEIVLCFVLQFLDVVLHSEMTDIST